MMELTQIGISDHLYKQIPSGLYVPEHIQRYPRAFDFFAGCGGFSLGIIQAGFEVVGACELDPNAAHTYMHNLGSYPINLHYSSDAQQERLENHFEQLYKKTLKGGKDIVEFEVSGSGWRKSELLAGNFYPGVTHFFFGDIRQYNGVEMLAQMGMQPGDLDLMVGGPPCQGFSNANSKSQMEKRNDPRNDLVFEYARMICEMQPKTFVMENVPQLISMYTSNGVPVLHQFLRILEDGNFMSYEAGLKALDIREKEMKMKLKYVPVPQMTKPVKKRTKETKQLGFKSQRKTSKETTLNLF